MKHFRFHVRGNRSALNQSRDQPIIPRAVHATVERMERRTLLSATGSISGTMYNDVNGDHLHQSYEPVLAGWGVYLDKNNNGKYDAGDVRVFSDTKGNYSFPNLPAGTYRIRQNTPAGWLHTNAAPFPFVVKLAAGQKVTGENILNQQLGVATLVSNGTLYVTGTNSADNIHVTLDAGGNSVVSTINGQISNFNFAQVKKVYINALAGDDTVLEDGGSESVPNPTRSTILGGDGNDTITDSFTDTITQAYPGDSIDGGNGNDTILTLNSGNDTVHGGAGNDSITNTPYEANYAYLYGDDGNDTLTVNDPTIGGVISGGAGADTVNYEVLGPGLKISLDGKANDGTQFVGYATNLEPDIETLNIINGAGTQSAQITGDNAGNIINYGGEGDVTIIGGSGNDYLNVDGAADSALVEGGAGNDTLKGFANDITLSGGDGNDLLIPENGTTTLSGGAGTDAVDYTKATGNLRIYLDGSQPSTNSANSEIDHFDGTVERVYGGSGNDLIVGNNSDDALFGFGGNDTLVAGSGHNALWGGDGNDLILARNNNSDYINGGAGNDTAHVDSIDTVVDVETIFES